MNKNYIRIDCGYTDSSFAIEIIKNIFNEIPEIKLALTYIDGLGIDAKYIREFGNDFEDKVNSSIYPLAVNYSFLCKMFSAYVDLIDLTIIGDIELICKNKNSFTREHYLTLNLIDSSYWTIKCLDQTILEKIWMNISEIVATKNIVKLICDNEVPLVRRSL
jgi:hypothetical protein